MKTKALIFVLTGAALLSACQPEERTEFQSRIHADDIAAALGMKQWMVQLPDDLSREHWVGLKVKHADGSVHRSGASSGHVSGEQIRVLLWNQPGDEHYDFAIVRKGSSLRGRIKVPYSGGVVTYPSEGLSILNIEHLMIKASEDDFVSRGHSLSDNEYGIRLEVRKNP